MITQISSFPTSSPLSWGPPCLPSDPSLVRNNSGFGSFLFPIPCSGALDTLILEREEDSSWCVQDLGVWGSLPSFSKWKMRTTSGSFFQLGGLGLQELGRCDIWHGLKPFSIPPPFSPQEKIIGGTKKVESSDISVLYPQGP